MATTPTAPIATSSGSTGTTTEEPPSGNEGVWGWIALALAAAQGETTETGTSSTPTVETSPTESVAPEETSSESGTPWGWIALALALALAALVVGLVAWRRRRASAASWSSRLADLARRSLAAMDNVLSEGSIVTGHVQALAGEARSLEAHAPDERSKSAASRLREHLGELESALEADRALRLSSPPPSPDQLSYSTALIRERVAQVQQLLRPPAGEAPR